MVVIFGAWAPMRIKNTSSLLGPKEKTYEFKKRNEDLKRT